MEPQGKASRCHSRLRDWKAKNMAANMTTGKVQQPLEDNPQRELSAIDARGGVLSGRVVTVLVISVLLVGVVFAMLWLTGV
jgi:hypothetical protein